MVGDGLDGLFEWVLVDATEAKVLLELGVEVET
jgi:hypothetical protein